MRLHLIRLFMFVVMSSCILTGCWDAKVIEEVFYVVAVGLDYDQDAKEYVLYAQFIDFSSIATGEGKPAEEIPPWIGVGKGETVKMAMQNLYDEGQQRIFWGHLSAVVLSENLLKSDIENPIDGLIRHPESRYIPWIYGTKQSMMDIFNITSIFNLSPLQTVIHNPYETFRQKSMIKPMTMNKFLRLFQEPTYTVLLPKIEVSDDIFHKDGQSHELYRINGAFLIQDEKYQGELNQVELSGYRWLQEETIRSPLLLRNGKEPTMVVTMAKPNYTIHHTLEGDQVIFNIDLHVQAHIKDVIKTIPPKEIEKKIIEIIEKEIRTTFLKGVELGTDILHLRDEVYRSNVRLWQSQVRRNGFELKEESLKEINVEVDINHSGKYQLHERDIYYDRYIKRIDP